jgi:hypothetical protein
VEIFLPQMGQGFASAEAFGGLPLGRGMSSDSEVSVALAEDDIESNDLTMELSIYYS